MNARTLSSVLLIGLILTGCFPDYFPRRRVNVNLSAGDIAGLWHLKDGRAKMLRRYHFDVTKEESFIQFFADGRCEIQKFHDGFVFVWGPGTWEMAQDDLQDKNATVMHITYRTAEKSSGSSLYFSRSHGKIILWQWYEDPDSREYIEYERN